MFINTNKLKTLRKRGLSVSIAEKALAHGSRIVPYNSHYRPNFIADINLPSDEFELERIGEDVASEMTVPRSFHNVMLDKGYDRIEAKSEACVTLRSQPIHRLVASLPNGRVFSDNLKTCAIITPSNRLLSEVSYQYVRESVMEEQSYIFQQRFFTKPKHVEGTLFVMIAGGVSGRGNYFHWLVDVLPRLQLLKESRFAGQVDKYLIPQYESDFQKTTLRLMGVEAKDVLACSSFEHLSCDRLIATSHPRGQRSVLVPDWIFAFYADLKTKLLTPAKRPKRMYVTRRDSTLRGIRDEDRLIDFLRTYGFEPVTLAEHDFGEKVNLFNDAEVVISAHGAGLTNLLFASDNAQVLELFSEGFVDAVLLNLAERKGVDYHYLIFEYKKAAHEDAKGQFEDIIVDYARLGEKLADMGLRQEA